MNESDISMQFLLLKWEELDLICCILGEVFVVFHYYPHVEFSLKCIQQNIQLTQGSMRNCVPNSLLAD